MQGNTTYIFELPGTNNLPFFPFIKGDAFKVDGHSLNSKIVLPRV